ncbi:MAG TPA: hypothetical protein VJ103_02450 [Candidatus Paceibacterota bacterium]|nr:hypothetical protein [Candidatus Paceibacterota bacterium]
MEQFPKPKQEQKNYEMVATKEGAIAVPKGKAEEFLNLPKEKREEWLKNNPVEMDK